MLQQLLAIQANPLYYWTTEKSTAEIDFVLQRGDKVMPIEVKAQENLKYKSLHVYADR